MGDLTAAMRFGVNVRFNENSKNLIIDLNDLKSIQVEDQEVGLDAASITKENLDKYASAILWALLQLSQSNQPVDNVDPEVQIYVSNQGKRSLSRGGTAQFSYQLVASAYQNDKSGITFDPSSMAA